MIFLAGKKRKTIKASKFLDMQKRVYRETGEKVLGFSASAEQDVLGLSTPHKSPA